MTYGTQRPHDVDVDMVDRGLRPGGDRHGVVSAHVTIHVIDGLTIRGVDLSHSRSQNGMEEMDTLREARHDDA